MGKADRLATPLRHQPVIILRIVAQQTGEGGAVNLLGYRGLVEFQITGPQPAPLGLVGGGKRSRATGWPGVPNLKFVPLASVVIPARPWT